MDKDRKILTLEERHAETNLFISPLITDGPNKTFLRDLRTNGCKSVGIDSMDPEAIDSIFSNAWKAMQFFASPEHDFPNNNLTKILAVGKVQSGKTAFFISCMAYAFDNGYQLAYLVGGTKSPLKDQNFGRVKEEFSNNPNVEVLNFGYADISSVENLLQAGKKVILVVLKNPSENKNLGALVDVARYFSKIPSLVIDDEGDEYSPGAPRTKKGNNKTHEMISELIYIPRTCTYLSVTATPQANLLISITDSLSPDYCVLVKPGKGYVGGSDFHDCIKNPRIQLITDQNDFKSSVPQSFKNALLYFITVACIKQSQGITKPFSMLVNPSTLTRVHSDVVEKIISAIREIKISLNEESVSYLDELTDIDKQLQIYNRVNPDAKIQIDDILDRLQYVVSQVKAYVYNATAEGRLNQDAAKDDPSLYKIYVGGSMLGRGLTIKNLAVTYIYNDSKKTAIDTLYQRARWLGYKSSYFDICRIYLTPEIQEKFISTVESETDMWNTLENFLTTKIDLKTFPRIFTLNDDRLLLTRQTVSHTVMVERLNPGYSYDKTIWLTKEERKENKKLADLFFNKHFNEGFEIRPSASEYQVDFVINTKISVFYTEFLILYHYPRGATIGRRIFSTFMTQVENGLIPDQISIIYMRYKTGEFRQSISKDTAIEELPQGRSNDGISYLGDRCLPEYDKKLHIQIHLVKTNKDAELDECFPVLALNNPISQGLIRFATGDNYYGD